MANLTIPARKPSQEESASKLTRSNRSKPENKRNIVNESQLLQEVYNTVLQKDAEFANKSNKTDFDRKVTNAYIDRYNKMFNQFEDKYGVAPAAALGHSIPDSEIILDDPKAPEIPEGFSALNIATMRHTLESSSYYIEPRAGEFQLPHETFTKDTGVADLPGGAQDPTGNASPLLLSPPSKPDTRIDEIIFEEGEDLLSGGSAEDTLVSDTKAQLRMKKMQEFENSFQPAASETKQVETDDPLGIRIGDFLARSVTDVPFSVMKGTVGAVKGLYNTVDNLVNGIYELSGGETAGKEETATSNLEQAKNDPTLFANQLEPGLFSPEKVGVVGNLTEVGTKFTLGFIPILKGLKALTVGVQLTGKAATTAGVLRGILAGGAAQTAVFDPMEARVSNLIKDLELTPDILLPIFEYLAVSQDDTQLEGYTKNFLEGTLAGGIGEGIGATVVKGLALYKYLRNLNNPTAGLPVTGISKDFQPGVKFSQDVTVTPEGIQPGSKEALTAEITQAQAVSDNLRAKAKTVATDTNAPQFRPALRDDATIIQGKQGQTHADIATEFNILQGDVESGFIDDAGKFYTRQEAKTLIDKHELQGLTREERRKLKLAETRASILQNRIATAKTSDELIVEGTKTETREKFFTKEEVDKGLPEEDVVGKQNAGFIKEEKFFTPEEARAATIKAIIESPGQKLKYTGKPGQAFGDSAAEARFIEGKTGIGPVINSLDTGVINSSKNIVEALDRIERLITLEKTPPKKFELKYLDKLARRLGVKVQALIDKQPELAINATKLKAYNLLMDASESNVMTMAKDIANGGDEVAGSEAVLAAFAKRLDNHMAIREYLTRGETHRNIEARFNKYNQPNVTKSIPEEIHRNLETLRDFGGAARTRRLAAAINENPDVAALNKALHNTSWKVFGDALTQYWYWSLLSGPITHAVNIASTAANLFWQVPARSLAGHVNELFIRSPNGVRVGEAREMLTAFYGSFADAWRLGKKAYRTGRATNTKFEYRVPQDAISAEAFGAEGTVFGSIFNFTGKLFKYTSTNALIGEDEFFRVLSTNMSMRASASRAASKLGFKYGSQEHTEEMLRVLGDPSELMLRDAYEFADLVTFQQELGMAGRKIQEILNMGGIFAKLIVPFQRTPTNIMKQAFRDTPLGLLSRNIQKDIASGGAAGQIAMAKMLFSTATAGLITGMVASDLVTGVGPYDPKLKATWLLTHQPNSIWMGKDWGWVSYNRIDPAAIVFSTVSSIAEGYFHWTPEEFGENFALLGVALSKSLFQKTWATSLAGAIDTAYDPTGPGASKWIKRQLSSLVVPSMVAQLTRSIDPVWRETDGIISAIQSRIPGLSKFLPPRRNIFGDKYWSTALGPDIISPFYEMVPPDPKTSPIHQWAWDNRLKMGMPSDTQRGVRLDMWQKDKFLQLSGNALKDPSTKLGMKDTLNALLLGTHPQSNEFKNLTDGPEGGKAYMVHRIVVQFREAALDYMYATDKVFRKQVDDFERQRAFNLLVGPGEIPKGTQ